MKQSLLIFLTILFGISACGPINEPQSSFTASSTVLVPDEVVYFYNSSQFADSYEWSFGDGTIDNSFEPSYSYAYPGIYNVRLSAYSADRVSDSYMTIEVIKAAVLNIQVLEYTDRYVVSGATVILYPSLTDWTNETNEVSEGVTNSNGVVIFYHLHPGYYYMDISNRYHDNYALAKDNVSFITTPLAESGYTSIFTAYVDYYSTAKNVAVTRKITTNTSTTKRTYSAVSVQKTKN